MGYSHKNSMRGGSHLTEQLLSIPSGSAPLRLLCVCCVRGESVSALMRQPPHTPPLVTAPLFRANAKLAHASCFQFPHWLQGGGPVQRAKSRVPFCCFTAGFDTSGMSKNGNAVSWVPVQAFKPPLLDLKSGSRSIVSVIWVQCETNCWGFILLADTSLCLNPLFSGRHGKGGTFPRQFQLPNRSKDYGDSKKPALLKQLQQRCYTEITTEHVYRTTRTQTTLYPAVWSQSSNFRCIFLTFKQDILKYYPLLESFFAPRGDLLHCWLAVSGSC